MAKEKSTQSDGTTMFALRSVSRFVEPEFEKSDHSAAAEYDAAQNAYLAASGVLTQFNAILAAVQAAAFSATAGALRASIATALVLHVFAAFVLCWAARPVDPGRSVDTMMSLAQSRLLVADTFVNYRRGWRVTMLAMVTSTVALMLYLIGESGFTFRI